MKVLRVFWIHKVYSGLVDNRKCDRLDTRYKNKPMQTDFPVETPFDKAKEKILSDNGFPPGHAGWFPQANNPSYAEVISHKIVELEREERPVIEAERLFEAPLFDGMTWASTFKERPKK